MPILSRVRGNDRFVERSLGVQSNRIQYARENVIREELVTMGVAYPQRDGRVSLLRSSILSRYRRVLVKRYSFLKEACLETPFVLVWPVAEHCSAVVS